MSNTEHRWYQLFLIWVNDPDTFRRYQELVAPIVVRHGGRADASFTPTAIHAEGLAPPDIVNLVSMSDRAAYEGFVTDPEFLEVRKLRDVSVDLLGVSGQLTVDNPSPAGGDRVYGIEVVRFAGGTPDAYRVYESEGEAAMARYGYQVHQVLDLTGDGRGNQPSPFDLAKVSSFPSPARRVEFEADPMHDRVENVLYPAAVAEVVWIDASHRPLP